jgi:hypothetical protein
MTFYLRLTVDGKYYITSDSIDREPFLAVDTFTTSENDLDPINPHDVASFQTPFQWDYWRPFNPNWKTILSSYGVDEHAQPMSLLGIDPDITESEAGTQGYNWDIIVALRTWCWDEDNGNVRPQELFAIHNSWTYPDPLGDTDLSDFLNFETPNSAYEPTFTITFADPVDSSFSTQGTNSVDMIGEEELNITASAYSEYDNGIIDTLDLFAVPLVNHVRMFNMTDVVWLRLNSIQASLATLISQVMTLNATPRTLNIYNIYYLTIIHITNIYYNDDLDSSQYEIDMLDYWDQVARDEAKDAAVSLATAPSSLDSETYVSSATPSDSTVTITDSNGDDVPATQVVADNKDRLVDETTPTDGSPGNSSIIVQDDGEGGLNVSTVIKSDSGRVVVTSGDANGLNGLSEQEVINTITYVSENHAATGNKSGLQVERYDVDGNKTSTTVIRQPVTD